MKNPFVASRTSAILAAILFAAHFAFAKTVSWGGGINNIWDTTTPNWTNAGVAVTYTDGDTVILDDSARTNNVNLTAARSPAAVIVSNSVLNYTFSGAAISGAGGLSIIGGGKLTLTAAQNYTGDTFVKRGTLALTGTATLSNSAEVKISAGIGYRAELDLSGATGPITLNSLVLSSNAFLSIAMPNVTTPVSVTALGVYGNQVFKPAIPTINVAALPPIASYPVTLTLIQSASPIILAQPLHLGDLPAGYVGSLTLSPNEQSVRLTLTGGPVAPQPTIGNIAISGGNVIVTGSNGTAGADYCVLASANAALPVSNWTRLQTNRFDANGNFIFTNAIDSPQRFFRLLLP